MRLFEKNSGLWTILFLFIFVLFAHGCSTTSKMKEENTRERISSSQQNTMPTDSTYQIQSGDEIEVLVWQQSKFNTTTKVSSTGTIAVPLIGEVQASGLTQDQLKRDLRKNLSDYIKGEINLTVSVRNTDNMQVAVFGMVSEPDNYPVVNKTSIFKVLSRAGGPSETANLRNVRIYRKNGTPDKSNSNYTTLNLTEYLEKGQEGPAAQVYPGDVVYVPEQKNAIREMSGFLGDVVLLFGIFRVFR